MSHSPEPQAAGALAQGTRQHSTWYTHRVCCSRTPGSPSCTGNC